MLMILMNLPAAPQENAGALRACRACECGSGARVVVRRAARVLNMNTDVLWPGGRGEAA